MATRVPQYPSNPIRPGAKVPTTTRKQKKQQEGQVKDEDRAIAAEAASDAGYAQSLLNQMFDEGAIGARTEEEKSVLAGLKTEAESAKEQDPYTKVALEKMQAGLEGISAPENQALRAQMLRANLGGQAGQLRALRATQGAAGITGGSATAGVANVLRSNAIARSLGESDLLAKNVAEKGRRLSEFSAFSNEAANSLFNRRTAATDRYYGATQTMADKERESQMQTYLGGIGLQMARRGALRGGKLGNKALELAMQTFGWKPQTTQTKSTE